MRKPIRIKNPDVPAMIKRGGKGVHGKTGYIRDKKVYEEESDEEIHRDEMYDIMKDDSIDGFWVDYMMGIYD